MPLGDSRTLTHIKCELFQRLYVARELVVEHNLKLLSKFGHVGVVFEKDILIRGKQYSLPDIFSEFDK
jgi:hypothetical protein